MGIFWCISITINVESCKKYIYPCQQLTLFLHFIKLWGWMTLPARACLDCEWIYMKVVVAKVQGWQAGRGLCQWYTWKVHCSRNSGWSGASHGQFSLFTKDILAPLAPRSFDVPTVPRLNITAVHRQTEPASSLSIFPVYKGASCPLLPPGLVFWERENHKTDFTHFHRTHVQQCEYWFRKTRV